jgi:tetratricopeptide (TPR) repeat protein
MSVQKLVTEAERLLDKGKTPEAIAKLKQALQEEPLNQIIATKLANVHVQNGAPVEAAKIFDALGKRLSDAGKSHVAIAIYKQAIELVPNDIALRVRFAQECESAGKMADAFLQAQVALQHYMQRKKFFDATSLMPLLARAQPKNEKIRMAWLEVLQLCRADQKLIHMLVAFCGPPGLVSQDFEVGGDPVALSSALYERLKELVPFFPREPRIAYAVAWAAYRRGRMKEFYHYLKECFRREPDFGLASLLFTRVLAEDKKLNESLFVYRYFKERMPADKSTDMLTLNRLLEAFVEKNGWIKFIEDSGDILDAVGFLESMTGKKIAAEAGKSQDSSGAESAGDKTKFKSKTDLELPPAEIDLGGMGGAPDANMEVVTFSSQAITEMLKTSKTTVPEAPAASPAAVTTPVSAPLPVPAIAENTGTLEGFKGDSVEFTALVRAPDAAPPKAAEEVPVENPTGATAGTRVETLAPEKEQTSLSVTISEEPPAQKLFNPLEQAQIPGETSSITLERAAERTQQFSPLEIFDAAKVMQNHELDEVKTKPTEIPPEEKNVSSAVIPESTFTLPEVDQAKWQKLDVEGSKTEIFSPVDAVQATADSRRPFESMIPKEDATSDATCVMPAPPATPEPVAEAKAVEAASAVVETPPEEEALVPEVPSPEAETAGTRVEASPADSPAFMPIPAAAESEVRAAAPDEGPDLGDDLLDGPTRIFTQPTTADKTEHLIEEIKQELKQKVDAHLNIEMLMKKAERYIAKRNYYLARKALRHAQHLGADEAMVKTRLADIRKLEFPEALYNTISSDRVSKVDTADVLDRLEQEFDLVQPDSEEFGELGSLVESRIEAIFQESDPRTILDFGVGLHEMGLFRQAEQLFIRLVEEFPEYAFDAYYLAANSKLSRRDYAGAASILKRLSSDSGKTEIEKIQIYYALGEIFEKMRQPDRSKVFFKKVAELDSNYRNIRHKLEE